MDSTITAMLLVTLLLAVTLWAALMLRKQCPCSRESFKETKLSDERPAASVLHTVQSGRHKIEVVDTGVDKLGKCMLLDEKLQFCEKDEHIYHEMLVHFPAMYVGKLKRVLIAGGGDCMALREVLKYDTVDEVIVIESEEHLISVSETQFLMSAHREDARVKWLVGDPNELVNKLKAQSEKLQTFDLIVVDGKERPGSSPFNAAFLESARLLLSHTGVAVRNGARHKAIMQSVFTSTLVFSFHSDTHNVQYTMVLGADFDLVGKSVNTDNLVRNKVHARFYKPDAHFSHIPWFTAMKVKKGPPNA